jgi:hypothetical protein
MNPFDEQGTPIGAFYTWVNNNLLGGNDRIRQASDALQDPDAVKNWTKNTLVSHGWAPDQAQWYADNVPVEVSGRDQFDQSLGGPGAAGVYYAPTPASPSGRVSLASDGGPNLDSTLPHEMTHAWDMTHDALDPRTHAAGRLADVNQALSDMGPQAAVTQWAGDRADDPYDWAGSLGGDLIRSAFRTVAPLGSYGKGDPAHTTQYLDQSLGTPYNDIPDWYRQKYMGFLGPK